MGNEESGMIEENSSEQSPARGGRRGAAGRSNTNSSSSSSNNYGDYSANSQSSTRKRGGRRGHGGGSSESSGSKHDSSSFADKSKTPKSSSSKNKDDMFSGMNLPLGETPKSISDKGRKAFNTAIWSPRADSNRSKARTVTNNNSANKTPSRTESQMKPIEEKKKAKSKQESDKKSEKPMFNFDSLYFNDSKPKDKKPPPKAEMDDDLFSNPFGVSGGGSVGGSLIILHDIVSTYLSAHARRRVHVCAEICVTASAISLSFNFLHFAQRITSYTTTNSCRRAEKPKKSRSINVDVKMGNAKLKHKVRSDRERKKQTRQNNAFHRPNSELMFDAFDDLEEEMIDDGVIGNGNRNEQPKRTDSMAPAKQLKWNTRSSHDSVREYDSFESNSSSGRHRGRGGDSGRGGNSDGWF